MTGKGTTDSIYIMRQVQEGWGYQARKKKLYYAFVDLNKAYDPREEMRLALRKLCVKEWLIRKVIVLYTKAWTVVKTDGVCLLSCCMLMT